MSPQQTTHHIRNNEGKIIKTIIYNEDRDQITIPPTIITQENIDDVCPELIETVGQLVDVNTKEFSVFKKLKLYKKHNKYKYNKPTAPLCQRHKPLVPQVQEELLKLHKELPKLCAIKTSPIKLSYWSPLKLWNYFKMGVTRVFQLIGKAR